MTVSAVSSAATNAATASTATTSSNAQLSKIQTQFLKLLTAELQNQDPTNPTDASSYMNQISQLYSLQQGSQTNDSLTSILSQLQASANGSLISYIGKSVDISSNQSPVQNGTANWDYTTDGSATSVTLTVTDANGVVVSSTTGDATAGTHSYSFDDSTHGSLFLSITGTDATGNTITPAVNAKATIDGVDTSSGQTLLTAGGIQFNPSDVVRIQSTTAS